MVLESLATIMARQASQSKPKSTVPYLTEKLPLELRQRIYKELLCVAPDERPSPEWNFTLFLVSRQVAQEAQDVIIKSHHFIRTVQYGPSSTVLKKGPLPKVCEAYSASLPRHLEARAEDQIVLTIRFGLVVVLLQHPKMPNLSVKAMLW